METLKPNELPPELALLILARAKLSSASRPSLISCFKSYFLMLSTVKKGGDAEQAVFYARLVRLYYLLLTFADFEGRPEVLQKYWDSILSESI